MQRLALTNTYSVTVELNAGKKTRNEKKKTRTKNIEPLFTLDSVYSTKASEAEQTTETNNSN